MRSIYAVMGQLVLAASNYAVFVVFARRLDPEAFIAFDQVEKGKDVPKFHAVDSHRLRKDEVRKGGEPGDSLRTAFEQEN